jgi:hypothetical protein
MALSWLASLGSVPALQGDEFAGTNLDDVFNETLGVRVSSISLMSNTKESIQFEKVFIVGLPEREDKFDSNTIASSLTGFKFTPMPGIRGKDVSLVSLPPVCLVYNVGLDHQPNETTDIRSQKGRRNHRCLACRAQYHSAGNQ